jgi:chromosomal replication initiation ATPase DnaA
MGSELTPAQMQSVRFLEALYQAHPERAVNGFRPPRIAHLQTTVERLQARIVELERGNADVSSDLRKATIDNSLLKRTVEEQQAVIDKLITEIDGGLIGNVPSIRRVVETVAAFYDMKMTELCGGSRKASVARIRMVAMYLCRELTGKSFPVIGRAIGDRDHTTIMHGHHTIARYLQDDERLNDEITLIKIRISEGPGDKAQA